MKITRFVAAGFCFLLALLFSFASPARARQKPPACCQSALKIIATSSVELLVTAPSGLKTGFNPTTGMHIQQIPSSSYYSAPIPTAKGPVDGRRVDISMPAAGRYMVQAIGQDSASYSMQFIFVNSKGGQHIQTFAGSASPGATFVFNVRYSPNPGAKTNVTRLAPFSSLSASIQVAAGPPPTLAVKGVFTSAAPSSAGIDPAGQPVSFHLPGYSVTIPPGSFKRDAKGNYSFEGTLEGIPLRMRIAPKAGGSFAFTVNVQNIDMTHAINPLRLLLILGDNAGATLVNAVKQKQ
jgi:hypothetical protein